MRSIWKGAVTFGLVNVPVKLYTATEDHDVALHQVHDKDGGRIKYQRRCEVCGRIVDYDHIDKAFDDGDRTVILTDEDLSTLPEERSREIEVVEFVPSDQVRSCLIAATFSSRTPSPPRRTRSCAERSSRPTAPPLCILRFGRKLGSVLSACTGMF
jgi:DNA end-binding protein Ku